MQTIAERIDFQSGRSNYSHVVLVLARRYKSIQGLTIPQAAEVLDVAPRTADAWWAFARAWLLAKIQGEQL